MKRQIVEDMRDRALQALYDCWHAANEEEDPTRLVGDFVPLTQTLHAECCRHLDSMQGPKGVPFRTSLMLYAQTRLIGVKGQTEHDTALIERALHLLTEALEVEGGGQ
jgi:hypothetical protein